MDLIDREWVLNNPEKPSTFVDAVMCAPTVDAIPMSVIEEIKADIIEMRKRDPLYYYVSTEDILDWVLNTIDRKVKEQTDENT